MKDQNRLRVPFKPLLSLTGVSKRFGAVHALDEVDLEVYPGQVVAVVGENGAGKSTLVKVLAGVHRPDAGVIHFEGAVVDPVDPASALRLGIATVFQDLALCDNLDVVANLFLGQELSPLRLDEVFMEARCRELLRGLSVDVPDLHLPVASLSRGQCQSVAIARCLLRDPKLLVLDEPTASLGVAETVEVLDLIERIRDRGTGVIVIGRNFDDVETVADIAVVLRMGRAVGVRAAGALTGRPVGHDVLRRASPRPSGSNRPAGPAAGATATRATMTTSAAGAGSSSAHPRAWPPG